MASADENAALIRRGYTYFNTGDLAGLAGLFAEEVVWHAGGRGRFAGEKRGRDATFAYFGQLADATGGTFRAELHDVVANAEHTLGLHTNTGQRQGRSLALPEVLVFDIRAGKIAQAWEYFEDSQAWDEFWR